MEKSEIKTWLDANIAGLLQEYGLPHWKIDVSFFQHANENWAAQCTAMPRYENALIEINCPKLEDIEELEKVFRHELCHVVHSPLHFFEEAVYSALEGLPNSEALVRTLKNMYGTSAELIAKNIERMHAGHVEKYKSQ